MVFVIQIEIINLPEILNFVVCNTAKIMFAPRIVILCKGLKRLDFGEKPIQIGYTYGMHRGGEVSFPEAFSQIL